MPDMFEFLIISGDSCFGQYQDANTFRVRNVDSICFMPGGLDLFNDRNIDRRILPGIDHLELKRTKRFVPAFAMFLLFLFIILLR